LVIFFIPKKKGIGNIIFKISTIVQKFCNKKLMFVPNFTPKNSPFISSLPYWDGKAPPPPQIY
jgi:hypothetical protein